MSPHPPVHGLHEGGVDDLHCHIHALVPPAEHLGARRAQGENSDSSPTSRALHTLDPHSRSQAAHQLSQLLQGGNGVNHSLAQVRAVGAGVGLGDRGRGGGGLGLSRCVGGGEGLWARRGAARGLPGHLPGRKPRTQWAWCSRTAAWRRR